MYSLSSLAEEESGGRQWENIVDMDEGIIAITTFPIFVLFFRNLNKIFLGNYFLQVIK